MAHAFNDEPTCYKLLQNNFFSDQRIVFQALSLYGVTQTSWVPIYNSLQQGIQSVPRMIHARAAMMTPPTPLEYPFRQDEAAIMLWDALYDIFYMVITNSAVIASTNVINNDDVEGMFNYIREQQSGKWMPCLGTGWQNLK